MVTPPPNNCPQSSGERVLKIVQMWHRDVQPGIVQSSDQIISRDTHGSKDLLPIKFQTCRSIVMLKQEWIISVTKYAFYRIKKVFWQCSDIIVGFHSGSYWYLHHYRDSSISIDHAWIFVYIFLPGCSPIPSSSPHNMQGWTLIHRRKVSRTSCLALTS